MIDAHVPAFRLRARSLLLGLAACAAAGGSPAFAQDKQTVKLQLNRLEPAADSCRTYILVDNGKGQSLKSLKVDLFAFDTEGVAQKRLAVELGPIAEKKTVVKIFDFAGMPCPKIGRLLLNDVLACEGGDVTRESCLERLQTETKASIPFDR